MPKGIPNKRYTPEFKEHVIETMLKEKLSYSETARRFEVNSRDRIKSWERIYLEEGPEGFAVERRGRGSRGRPPKQMPQKVEEDLLAEVQRQITVAKLCRDAAIAISASVFMVNCCDFFLSCLVLICAVHPFQMIIERRTGQLSDGKKNCERMLLPQLLNYQRFLCWRRSSSKTKACKFFR